MRYLFYYPDAGRSDNSVIDITNACIYNYSMAGYFESFGGWFLSKVQNTIDFCAYTYLIIKTGVGKKPGGYRTNLNVLFKQVLFTGVDALPLIAIVALAIGGISIIQSLTFLPRFGGESFIGNILITVIVRELGPLLTGFIVIGRSGTAITTEIGNMVVSHEIEALESMGIDPVRYIVLPRIFGMTASLVSLNIYFDIFAILGGFFVSKLVLVTSFIPFLHRLLESVVLSDLTISLLKGFIFGILISLTSSYRGFSVKTSSTEVPQMTTKGVVNSITALFLADGLITFIYYF
jgi:phospholipid/cholesterol/gamma-HCH transport system permease protein